MLGNERKKGGESGKKEDIKNKDEQVLKSKKKKGKIQKKGRIKRVLLKNIISTHI